MERPPERFTELMQDVAAGNEAAAERLFVRVYDELRRVAASAMRGERSNHTLQPTALVHEAYLRLAGEPSGRWQDQAHFLAVAARAMRHVLVDHARAHAAQKRGDGADRLTLEDVDAGAEDPRQNLDLLLLDEALGRLAKLDPRQEQIVELRYFGGLSVEETAEAVGVSPRTVKREWQMAKAWLQREMARLSVS